jgi:hypothetical protein
MRVGNEKSGILRNGDMRVQTVKGISWAENQSGAPMRERREAISI